MYNSPGLKRLVLELDKLLRSGKNYDIFIGVRRSQLDKMTVLDVKFNKTINLQTRERYENGCQEYSGKVSGDKKQQ